MMKILPVSLRSRWSCAPLCLALAFAGCGGGNGGVVDGGKGAGKGGVLDGGAGGASGGVFDGEKAPYGPKTPTTQVHSTLAVSSSLSTSTAVSQTTAVVGQKAIGGVTYDRLATTRVDDPSKGGEYWVKDNPDGTVDFAGFMHSSLVGGLIPGASMTLTQPINVKLEPAIGVAQTVTAKGTLTLTDTLATSSADVTGQYTLVEKDVAATTGMGPLSGCSHFSGQATSNSEGVPAAFRGMPISADLWYHPSYGVVAFNAPGIGIGTAMSDSSDCGSVDSSNHRIIRKVGVVDSSSSFKLDTYDCDGNQIAADKNTHAQMLLELRWVDETKAQADTQPQPNVEFGTAIGYFPNNMAESPASVFHPEENGKGFKYWYSYVSQAAKNEPGDNSTSYHISVRAVTGLSPVRVTARIYYKVLPEKVGAMPDAGPVYTGGADSGLAGRADSGVASPPDSGLASDSRDGGSATDSRADAGTADAPPTYFTVGTPPVGITAPSGAKVSALTTTKTFGVGGIFWKDGRLFSASNLGGPIVSVMPGETGTLWADVPSLAGGSPSWRHGVPLTGGNILLAIDYNGGGPTGLHEITPTGIDTPWKLASGHSGIGDIVALPSLGWVFSDFESYSIFKVLAKDATETSLIPAGSGSYSPAYLAYDALTDTLYFVNMNNLGGESWFGGDGAIYKLTGTATSSAPVLVAKAPTAPTAPTGARFNGLAIGLGGLFPAGLYASDTANSQVVRVESTGTLTPAITGVPTPGELRIDPVSKGLALLSADQVLFFLGTGTGGGLDAGAKDVGVATDSRPDATGPTTCNLIVNGNAEAAIGSADGSPVATPGWTSTGEATAIQYGASGWLALTDPGPADRGLNNFTGGWSDETSSLTQTVTVSQFSSTIDVNQVTYVLSGWLGGYDGQDDNATLTVTFQSASGTALGTGSIGPVTSSDRAGVTGLLQRSSTGAVPAGTRTVSVVLSLVRTEGTANDGYADNLSLVFSGTGAAACNPGVSADGGTTGGGPDAAAQDASGGCGTGCPAGQQCLSGQCCVPPAAGGECTTFPACGCPAGQVCYLSTTQALACFAGNNLPEGADCSSDLTCQTGLGCLDGVCRPYCGTDADCPMVAGVRSCLAIYWPDNSPILGVKLCARICDPVHPQSPTAPLLSCPTGFSCGPSPDGASSCFKASPSSAAGSACTSNMNCPAGYACTGTSATTLVCKQYCLSSSDCVSGTCQFTWITPQYAGTSEVGYCQ